MPSSEVDRLIPETYGRLAVATGVGIVSGLIGGPRFGLELGAGIWGTLKAIELVDSSAERAEVSVRAGRKIRPYLESLRAFVQGALVGGIGVGIIGHGLFGQTMDIKYAGAAALIFGAISGVTVLDRFFKARREGYHFLR